LKKKNINRQNMHNNHLKKSNARTHPTALNKTDPKTTQKKRQPAHIALLLASQRTRSATQGIPAYMYLHSNSNKKEMFSLEDLEERVGVSKPKGVVRGKKRPSDSHFRGR
jgi:hypothetical protein